MAKKLTKKQLKKPRETLTQDILNIYNNLEYWDMDLADSRLQDWLISDECNDEIYKELVGGGKKVKVAVEQFITFAGMSSNRQDSR